MEPDIRQMTALFPDISAQLRSVMSSLHLAAAQMVPAEVREADPELDQKAALLDQSYYRLMRLANNLTILAELGDAEPQPEYDQDIVDAVLKTFEQGVDLAELLGIHLSFSCAMDRHICAFRRQDVEQIVLQLLSNALKFTSGGGTVTVELKRSGRQLLLSVTDTGRGIPQEQMPGLFEAAHTPGFVVPPQGAGLGLAIVRLLAERMGGSVAAVSREGEGSAFTVSLPDRQCGLLRLSDVPGDYSGGFNKTLLGLADALPPKAFCIRSQG